MNPVIEVASESTAPAWDGFVQSAPQASPYHLWRWRRVVEQSFRRPCIYLTAREGSEITGVLPLVRQRRLPRGSYLTSLPYVNYGGILACNEDAAHQLSQSAVDVARQQGDQHLEMRHATLVETGLPAQTRKVSMRLQLPASAETLWKDLAAKVRSQVRRGMKERTAIRWGGKELVPVFYRLLAERWRDLGTPLYARSFFDAVMEAFPHQTQEEEAPRAAICLVTLDDKPAAAGLLLGYRSLMEIPWAASRPQFNRQAVNMLLYWSALEFACHRGYEVFDFGRCSPDSGTHRFKAQWGAKPLPLPWAYWTPDGSPPDLNPDNPRYALAIRTWQRLPVAITRLIGPRIAPHLP